ncbi:sn-glycerol-3-phosphate import ATP-binding protein UgpC [Peptococcaceae bacterium CEB3]|nr:sn-glycerol-3-phosphate import ATP-binding protein UgpC [Peptococcaceae bacterium CEB3]
MASVILRNISKQFNGNTALHQVSLEIADREFFVLFGPSGAGKTTVLNTVCGIYLPDQGDVFLGKTNVTSQEIRDRNVSMVFESYALYPHLTVYENMAFPLKSPKIKWPKEKIEKTVKSVAAILQIDGLLERKPSQLSNGQRQRVAIGRSLVRSPAVSLMDEPLAHLDAKLRNEMRIEFKEMQGTLTSTIIYATPDYREALSLGNRVAVLNKGRIIQVDTPQTLYHRPADIFVASLLSDPQINLLPVTYLEKSGHGHFYIKDLKNPGLKVNENLTRFLSNYPGREFLLGIRPHNITVTDTMRGEGTVGGLVYGFERRGINNIMTLKNRNLFMEVVLPASIVRKINDTVTCNVSTEECLLFDPDTKKLVYSASDRLEGLNCQS